MQDFGMRLKEFRQFAGKKQKEVSDILMCSVQCYSSYEQGKTEPNLETLVKLAKYFEVTTDELLGIETSDIHVTNAKNIYVQKFINLSEEKKNRVLGYIDSLTES